MNLTDWSIKNIRPVVFLTVLLCLAGAAMYRVFPVSILPDVTFPRVVVIAESIDRPAQTVEVSITRPIEDSVVSVPGVRRIRSKTKRGSTEISIDFVDGTDVLAAEQLVNTKVNQVRSELPADTTTEVERMNPTVFPIYGLTLTSKSLSQTELLNLAIYRLRPRLARVDGVARVVVQGGQQSEICVTVRPDQLSALGLTSSDVTQAIQASNLVRSVGKLDHEFKQFHVVVNAERRTLESLRSIAVATRAGTPIRLDQVADLASTAEDRTTVVSANGAESVLLNIIRQPTANAVAMVEGVRKELATLKAALPRDAEIGVYYDQSVLIKSAVDSVREAVLIGAILSVAVLMLFLRNLRATLVTASIIPATLLITFLLMRLAGLSLNLMTLGALAVGVGLIIDDAIVVVECVFRNLADAESVAEAVKLASRQIAAPMISSTATTVVVFLPLAFLQGVSGAFFFALALTLTMALIVSLVLALCVSPSLCAAFLRPRDGGHAEDGFFQRLQNGYVKTLRALLRHKWIVIPIAGATLFGTWALASQLKSDFMPTLDEGAFILDYWSPAGSSLAESDRLLRKVDAILQATPEIDTFSRRTGTELGFAITETNRGDYAITLKTNRKRAIEDVIADVREHIQSEVGGLDIEFVQVLQDLLNDLAGNPEPMEIRLFGENKAQLHEVAKAFAEDLAKIKGLADVKSGIVESGPEFHFVPDDGHLARRGLTADQVATQLEAAIFGTVATKVIQGDRQIPVRVRFPESYRNRLDAIKTIPIQTATGHVPLGELGEITAVAGTAQSNREDQRRVISVTAQLDHTDLGTVSKKVQALIRSTPLPPGVTARLAGQYQSQQQSFQNLELVLGASVILVFAVMMFQFRRFDAPIVVLILMPLSLFGAALALYISHTALNVSSFMGIIMLAGIVVKNGILLLDRAQVSIDAGRSRDEAVVDAGQTRLRPILMTTLTAILGLVPLALGFGAGAEMQKPLAIAVIGGLAFSTVLTLLIGPLIYATSFKKNPTR